MSQAATRPTPPAKTGPCTRAIVGFFKVSMVCSRVAKFIASAWFCSTGQSAMRCIHFRSAPAQKLLPTPARITARTAGSSFSVRIAAISSEIIVSSNTLCNSGRFIQTIPMLCLISTNRVWYFMFSS